MANGAVTRAGSTGASGTVPLPRSWGVGAVSRREEVRLGPLEPLAAEEQVYLFVVEGHQSRDGLELAGREVVGPRQIGVHRAAGADRPVPAGGALVRAAGDGAAGAQVAEADLRLGPPGVLPR